MCLMCSAEGGGGFSTPRTPPGRHYFHAKGDGFVGGGVGGAGGDAGALRMYIAECAHHYIL